MIYKLVTTGIDKDVRSDDEDCADDTYESPTNKKKTAKKKEFES